MQKVRRRFVETAKSTHCHLGRAEVTEHVERAVLGASDNSKVEVSRSGGCVTIRTLERQTVLADAAPTLLGAPSSPSEPSDS
jgi:hypothetical protein